jgi:hypothetical protein
MSQDPSRPKARQDLTCPAVTPLASRHSATNSHTCLVWSGLFQCVCTLTRGNETDKHGNTEACVVINARDAGEHQMRWFPVTTAGQGVHLRYRIIAVSILVWTFLLSVRQTLNISKASYNFRDHVHCRFQLDLGLSLILKTRVTAWENLRGMEIKLREFRIQDSGLLEHVLLLLNHHLRSHHSSFADN